jgi:hypothetical protein
VSLLGIMHIERAYYYCPHCHKGHVPTDQLLQLTERQQTPAAEEAITLMGTLESFATAADRALQRLSGIDVSESTVERTTEAAGQRLVDATSHGRTFGEATTWAWHRDAEGKTCAYLACDATGLGMQGKKGARADGRMANVAMIYNPIPEEPSRWAQPKSSRRPAFQARYLAGLDPMMEQMQRLRRVAAQVGMQQAERWIALSDGGAGLEEAVRVNFPLVIMVILDFWHAAEHVHAFAKQWQPENAQTCGQQWCELLKEQGGASLLQTLRALPISRRKKSIQEAHRQLVGYVENQLHRMDYPTYRKKGWQIGSGPVEAACKAVIGQRLKGTGMRWGLQGAQALCHLRALLCSDDHAWQTFWAIAT